jgi:hypothetical protein
MTSVLWGMVTDEKESEWKGTERIEAGTTPNRLKK